MRFIRGYPPFKRRDDAVPGRHSDQTLFVYELVHTMTEGEMLRLLLRRLKAPRALEASDAVIGVMITGVMMIGVVILFYYLMLVILCNAPHMRIRVRGDI